MPNYRVTVGGKEYDVQAADPKQAWQRANRHVEMRAERRKALAEKYKAEDAARDPTEGMSGLDKVRANLGAGMMDWYVGGKQLFNQATPEEAREKRRLDEQLAERTTGGRALQFAGAALPAIPLGIGAAMAAPATATTFAGGAALGGGMGAFTPTEDPNMLRGKATNITLGALTGGTANKVLPLVAPAIRGAASATVNTARRLTDAGRTRLARDAFLKQFPDEVSAQRALEKLGDDFHTRDIPGTQPTTAQMLNDPTMLAAERRLANTGGEAQGQLAARRAQSNEARYDFLEDNLSADVQALKDAASEFAEANKPKKFTQPFNQRPVIAQLTRLSNLTNNERAKAALESIAERVRSATMSRNPVEQLHQVRMFEIDDALSRLASTDSKLAGQMRRELMAVKESLDNQLIKATDGQWRIFLDGYQKVARQRDIGVAGMELLREVGKATPDAAGNPQLTTLRKALRGKLGEVDEFGKPLYGEHGERAISDVVQSLDREALTQVERSAGSATAFNQAAGAGGIDDVLRPLTGQVGRSTLGQRAVGDATGSVVGGAGGFVLGGPIGGALGAAAGGGTAEVLQRMAHGRAIDVARKLFAMQLEPALAAQALKDAVARGHFTPSAAQKILSMLARARASASAPLTRRAGPRVLAAPAGALAGVRSAAGAVPTISMAETLRRRDGE